MCFLSTALLSDGYEVWIQDADDKKPYQIQLGENEATDRMIKKEHNLYSLWASGEFKGSVPFGFYNL